MPLVRAEVKNAYALGAPELYREANKEDPKEVLEGVAVAGLVGVLRQLGDLSEFAAEVFHGLQEEVTRTSSRSRKLMDRVHRIEAALSPLEKVVLAQKSHLHFAYTAGSNWHARIRCQKSHFLHSDLPEFIMDSYEDSRDPPHLHLLDKYDVSGPGSCLKRYSDPTFFKRANLASVEVSTKKIPKDKKSRRIKKRRSWPRSGEFPRNAPFSYNSGRMQFTQLNTGQQPSPTQTASTLRSELDGQFNLDLRNGSGYTESDTRPSYSVQPEEQDSRESISSPVKRHSNDFLDYNFLGEKVTDTRGAILMNLSQEQAASSSSATWDEKRESVEHENVIVRGNAISFDVAKQEDDHNTKSSEAVSQNLGLETIGNNDINFEMIGTLDALPFNQTALVVQEPTGVHLGDNESETDQFMDALYTIESEADTDVDCRKRQEIELDSKLEDEGVHELVRHNSGCQSSSNETNDFAHFSQPDGGFVQLNSTPPRSPRGANCSDSGAAVIAEFDSVSPADKALQLSQTAEVSSTPGSPLNVGSGENETNYFAHFSQPDGGFVQLNSTTPPRSPHGANYSDRGTAVIAEFDSVSPADKALQLSQTAEVSSTPGGSLTVGSGENRRIVAGNSVDSVSSSVSSNSRDSGSGIPSTGGTVNSFEPQKHASDTSSVASVSFWTNGGLLGLQPSKPPDFAVSNGIPQDSTQKKDVKNITSGHSENKIEEDYNMNGSDSHDYQENGISFRKTSWKISPDDLDIKQKLAESLYPNNANSTGSSAAAPGIVLPVNSTVQPARKNQDSNTSSSRMFELSNRLLSTGSSKRLLPSEDEKSYSAEKHGNALNRSLSGRSRDLIHSKSPIFSPASSPPLAHMKISFQPIDGFETSKLKLKFPDGNINSGSGRDIFPSFQLVPEESITQHQGFDSDADTFYRSSPSASDDYHSNHSESNSDLWESSESPVGKDHEMYDAFRRISVTESISSVPENGETNHDSNGIQFPMVGNSLEISKSSQMFDMQSLGSINSSFRKVQRNGNHPKDPVEPRFEPTPPPVEWQGVISHFDGAGNKYGAVPEGFYRGTLDLTRSASTVSQPKPAPSSEDHISTNMQKSKSSSKSWNTNGQREANQKKAIDEKGDFLHQIRTKSFNLRPTFTEKSTVLAEASANVQVTAILEKAIAIRQAVASDDDDGTWSDN